MKSLAEILTRRRGNTPHIPMSRSTRVCGVLELNPL